MILLSLIFDLCLQRINGFPLPSWASIPGVMDLLQYLSDRSMTFLYETKEKSRLRGGKHIVSLFLSNYQWFFACLSYLENDILLQILTFHHPIMCSNFQGTRLKVHYRRYLRCLDQIAFARVNQRVVRVYSFEIIDRLC